MRRLRSFFLLMGFWAQFLYAGDGRKDIHQAVCDGDLERVKRIVARWPRCINDQDLGTGETPLILAVMLGEEDIVRFFVEESQLGRAFGLNLKKFDRKQKNNVLHTAFLCNGYVRILDLIMRYLSRLIQSGLLRNMGFLYRKNQEGKTIFDILLTENFMNRALILEKLLSLGFCPPTWVPFEDFLRTNPLYILAYWNDWESFFILDECYPFLVLDSIELPFGWLSTASRFGNSSVITRLLKKDFFLEFMEAARKHGKTYPFFEIFRRFSSERLSEKEELKIRSSDDYDLLSLWELLVSAFEEILSIDFLNR